MQSFKITKEELETFARKLYSEACCGYLDLCEAVTDKMVTDFLDGRTPVTASLLAGFPPSNSISPSVIVSSGDYSFGGGVTGPPFTSGAGIAINSGSEIPPADPAYQRPNNPYPASLETAGYQGHGSAAFAQAMVNSDRPTQEERDAIYQSTPSSTPSLFDGVDFSPEIASDNSVVVVREELFVRAENFVGNESERF
jgi:hypothetical protein